MIHPPKRSIYTHNANKIGRMVLLTMLEGIVADHIELESENERNPLYLFDDEIVRGPKHQILKFDSKNVQEIFQSGRYKFGSKKLFIFQALDNIIDYLDDIGIIDYEALLDEELDLQESFKIEEMEQTNP